MTKYVSIAYLFENRDRITDPQILSIMDSIELLYRQLGERVADVFDAEMNALISHVGGLSDFGFRPKQPNSSCPPLIAEADPGGDWR